MSCWPGVRSLAERDRLDDEACYGSEEWRRRWREDVLAGIEDYHTLVIETAPEVIAVPARPR